MANGKWTEDITFKFVQEYLKHECLYNFKDPKYKNKGAKQVALQQISKTMNISGFGSKEAYTKIRNLKSTYSQETKKIKERRSGAGKDYVYVPQLKWFKLLDDALNAINIQCRDSPINMELADSQDDILDGPATFQNIQCNQKYSPDATPELTTNQNNHNEEERTSSISRKRKIRALSRLVNKVKKLADTINTPSVPTQTESEFDLFGRSVAAQLKNMPMHLAIQAQMSIQTYLGNLRLQEMGHESQDSGNIVITHCDPLKSSPSTPSYR